MAKVPPGQCCEKCRYFRNYEAKHRGMDGICARFPPTFSANTTAYPETSKGGWCGEFASDNPETLTEGAATMARAVLLGDLTAARALADYLKEGGS